MGLISRVSSRTYRSYRMAGDDLLESKNSIQENLEIESPATATEEVNETATTAKTVTIQDTSNDPFKQESSTYLVPTGITGKQNPDELDTETSSFKHHKKRRRSRTPSTNESRR